MKEYKVISCLGHLNMAKAIEEHPGWEVHSFCGADVEEHQVGEKLLMEVQILRVTRFVLLLMREQPDDPSLGKDRNPGGIVVTK
jgi:hypothetical protein